MRMHRAPARGAARAITSRGSRASSWPAAVAAALVAVAAGCAGQRAPAVPSMLVAGVPAVASAVHEDVASLGWLVGRWVSEDGTAEDVWTPASDGLYGVSWQTVGGRTAAWEVALLARDHAGQVVYRAMPAGAPGASFPIDRAGDRAVLFSRPAHDFPKQIAYARRDAPGAARLGIRIAGAGRSTDLRRVLAVPVPAPELEEVDRRWSEAVAAGGLEAWVSAFDDSDGVLARGARRFEGAAAIRAASAPMFADPDERLVWGPIASGLAPAGDLGFTVGLWEIQRRSFLRGFAPVAGETGAYVTLWRRAADGTWRVRFDVGEPLGLPAPPDPSGEAARGDRDPLTYEP